MVTNGIDSVQVQSPDNQKNDDISSSSMADTLKTQEEAMSQLESQGQKNTDIPAQSGRRNSLTWGRVSLFVLARPSTDWMRATHIREGNLLSSVYQFMPISSKNTVTDTPRIII